MLHAFVNYSSDTRSVLMKSSWNELFALGLLQCQDVLSLTHVMNAFLLHQQESTANNDSPSQIIAVAEHANKLNLFLKSALELNMDDFEIAALKTLVLFSPGLIAYYY